MRQPSDSAEQMSPRSKSVREEVSQDFAVRSAGSAAGGHTFLEVTSII